MAAVGGRAEPVLLVLLNGAPASGKSTVARALAAEHPLSLVLDIDVLRSALGDWFAHPQESGLRARAMAIAAAEVQLRAGGDVYVPQFLGRPGFVDELAALAERTGACFVEMLLDADADELQTRFDARTSAGDRAEHGDADRLQRSSGAVLADQVTAAREVAATRVGTVIVDARGADPALVLARVRGVLAAARAE